MSLGRAGRLVAFVALGAGLWLCVGANVHAQEAAQEGEAAVIVLANGGLEVADEQGRPDGWSFVARPEGKQTVVLDVEASFEGERAAAIDCASGPNEFTNLMQAMDATAVQGKRVRFRAAVRTADLAASARVQLWFRIDRPSGMGAFDNMQNRPISSAEWQHFDIVLDVADDATRLNVGMFVIGQGKAWIDDASLEVVDEEVEATSVAMDDNLSAAMAAAADAPTQPFFTPWLWLALAVLALFGISQVGAGDVDDASARPEQGGAEQGEAQQGGAGQAGQGGLVQFALRFSVLYWLLYSLPQPFRSIAPSFLRPVLGVYTDGMDAVVRWTAAVVFGVQGEMVGPNGSGDTTYAYVSLFVGFVLASVGAVVWSLIGRLRARALGNDRVINDLLRSYLRYVLAATMIGYGLAKVGFIRNQFSSPGEYQLARTYGESSPMGLLWTFMGASRVYTFFGGLGELLGGVLLLWRRTTTLGAIVVMGVMTNVVMLNFAYDVPVKQYSAHLVVMAMFLLLPEARRLANVVVLNRPVGVRELGPPYVKADVRVQGGWRRRVVWGRWAVKLVLVLFVGLVPVVGHAWREVQYARAGGGGGEGEGEGVVAEEGAGGESDGEEGPLLMNRGFRWVSEVPFNR